MFRLIRRKPSSGPPAMGPRTTVPSQLLQPIGAQQPIDISEMAKQVTIKESRIIICPSKKLLVPDARLQVIGRQGLAYPKNPYN
jgi:hypothetical protein